MTQWESSKHDILILGGGPSGLSTALHLQKIAPHLARRILILEKEHYPRLKLCAGGLVIDAEIILERLGLDVREVPHVDVERAHFNFAGKGLVVHLPKRHAIRVIRRDEFDAWLAKKTREAGMEIQEGITVKKISPNKDDVSVETDQGIFLTQIVVGADGSNGVTRRSIFPKVSTSTARVLEVITPANQVDKSCSQSITTHEERDAYFEFIPVPDNIAGYVWDFPTQINGEAMRCWGIYDTNLLAEESRPALKGPLAQEMKRHGFILNDYAIKGHPIHWYNPRNQISIPRMLLVGDAAGADPTFGEGISIALGYGAIAAREISESFQRNEFSFNRYKRRLTRSALGRTLFARWVIMHIIYSIKWKWFQFLLWRMAKPIVLIMAWVFVLNWSKRIK